MTAADHARTSTEELLRQFIEKTQHIGSAWTFSFKVVPASPNGENDPRSPTVEFDFKVPPGPERERVKKEIHAIGAELRARKAVTVVRRLFDHADRDVRGWASAQFGLLDPEWAAATSSGLAEDLTTREVLALRARVLEGPPSRPTLAEMSVDQLAACFEDASVRLYATRFFYDDQGMQDIEAYNRVADEIYDIVQALKARDALRALVPLFDHAVITVRCEAAIYALSVAPEPAIAVLETMADKPYLRESSAASWTLRRWRESAEGKTAPSPPPKTPR